MLLLNLFNSSLHQTQIIIIFVLWLLLFEGGKWWLIELIFFNIISQEHSIIDQVIVRCITRGFTDARLSPSDLWPLVHEGSCTWKRFIATTPECMWWGRGSRMDVFIPADRYSWWCALMVFFWLSNKNGFTSLTNQFKHWFYCRNNQWLNQGLIWSIL